MKKLKNLIFDIDGTLWDIRSICADNYNRILKQKGLSHLCVDAEGLRQMFGRPIPQIADLIFGSIPAPQRYALIDECDKCFQKGLPAATAANGFPGIQDAIAHLSRKYDLYIVSNCSKGYVELATEKLEIENNFKGHLCFGDTGVDKGHTILKLMEKYHLTDCAYIGDTQGDYEATQIAGIPFIWCAYGFGQPAGYTAKVNAPAELITLLI